MGRLIEGVWDCKYCGTDKIRGKIRVCPVCDRQRDLDVKFYMDDPKNYVPKDEAEKINRNQDWLCPYCDALNSDDLQQCHICGSDRAESKQKYFDRRKEVEERQKRNESTNNTKQNATKSSIRKIGNVGDPLPDQSNNPEKLRAELENLVSSKTGINTQKLKNTSKKKVGVFKKILSGGAGILALILIATLLIGLFTPKELDATVSDFSWERSIDVQELQTVTEDGWSLPSDARLLYSQEEIQSYQDVIDHYETKTRTYTEQVLDHYEEYVSGYNDLGNGYFKEIVSQRPVYRTEERTETYEEPVYRQEPVYATKYYYERDVWKTIYASTSSGNDKTPYWNEPELINNQREGSRTETYKIKVLTEDNEFETYRFSFNDWNNLNVNDKIRIKVDAFGFASIVTE